MCIAVTSGCATTATITRLEPASADVSSLRRLAVLHCAGPEGSGPIAHNTIVSTLAENGYYSLIDPAELERFAPAPLYDAEGKANTMVAIEAARRMRLDAILIPRVRYRRAGGLGGGTIQFGDPTVAALVNCELIDVRTGQILANDRTTAPYKGELTDDRTGPTSRKKVLARLMQKAAAEAAGKIAPHQTQRDVRLAGATFGKGAGAIRQGNELARQGDWAKAMEQWQSALAENPESDAAMYNLGVACEAVNDFERARRMYAAAAERSDNELYRKALARVERSGREYQVALMQINRAGQPRSQPPVNYAHARAGR
jgi:tetratricopeptide (TPR) repeat protein